MKTNLPIRLFIVSILLSLFSVSFAGVGSPATASETYSVTYDLNEAPGQAPGVENFSIGDVVVVPQNPVWEGHIFLGWLNSFYNSVWGGPVQMFDVFEMPNENLVMTAQWESVEHPIVREVFNNNIYDEGLLWSYFGGSVHTGVDVLPGWCVVSGENADPKTWIIGNKYADPESETFELEAAGEFKSGTYYELSPDPSISVSTGASQVVTLGSAITDVTIENSGCEATNYDINPGLPAGLEFNFETWTISGTPLETQENTTYEITTERWFVLDDEAGPEKLGWSTTSFELEVQEEVQLSLTKKISRFKPSETKLVPALKDKIAGWVESLPQDSEISCQGAVRKAQVTNTRKLLATKRALAVCKYAKQIRSDITYIVKEKPLLTELKKARYVLMKVVS
jgi:hypothetical protein